MNSFKKFLIEDPMSEGWLDRFTKKKPQDNSDNVAGDYLQSRLQTSAENDAPGSLYQALLVYNYLNGKNGVHYPAAMIDSIVKSVRAKKTWQEKYQEMFRSAVEGGQAETAKMILDRAFRELGVPAPRPTQPEKPQATPPDAPSFDEIVQYIQKLLRQNKTLEQKAAKALVKKQFPGLAKYKSWLDARIGKAWIKATRPTIAQRPEPEEHNPDILKFPR